jgi:hypothetical protein
VLTGLLPFSVLIAGGLFCVVVALQFQGKVFFALSQRCDFKVMAKVAL